MKYPPKNARDFLVTPEIATDWLEHRAAIQRPVSDSRVKSYSTDMKDGLWKPCADPITFDTNGKLINAQHRLLALKRADKAIRFDVRIDMPPETYHITDQVYVRTLAHTRAREGEPNYATRAGCERLVFMYDNQMTRAMSGGGWCKATQARIDKYGREELDGDLLSLASLRAKTLNALMQQNAAAAAFYICHRADAVKASEFFAVLESGANLVVGMPVHTLRESLIRQKALHDRKQRRDSVDNLEIVIRAWNAMRENRTIYHLRVVRSKTPNKMERKSARFPVAI